MGINESVVLPVTAADFFSPVGSVGGRAEGNSPVSLIIPPYSDGDGGRDDTVGLIELLLEVARQVLRPQAQQFVAALYRLHDPGYCLVVDE